MFAVVPTILRQRVAELNAAALGRNLTFNRVPPDKTITQAVKDAMASEPANIVRAAKLAGVDGHRYAFIRKMLLLSEQQIAREDRETLGAALVTLDRDRSLHNVDKAAVEEIFSRNWRRKKDSSYVIKRSMKQFDATLLNIQESCSLLVEDVLIIPRGLTNAQRDDAVVLLARSSGQISRMIRRLLGETEERQDD